jgi:glycosyltransferase involved in cell wall biosynthesis/SAM-dependent methyltransferase/Flp pilus assembly protein TadD
LKGEGKFMTTRSKPQALLIQLEFPTWQMARPWTYSACFAIREGLEANGIECHTIPAIPSSPSSVALDWLRHAERLCKGKRFDQVWVWLVHYEYDQRFLEWIASLAPVRVGFVMESLTYSEEEHRFSPITRQRKAVVDRQLPYLTHALLADEIDAHAVSATGNVKPLWCPAFVPERFIVQNETPAFRNVAVFHGTTYGHRKSWLENPALRGRLVLSPSKPTEAQRLFDQLHLVAAQALKDRGADVESLLPQYVSELQRIRLAEFTQWMDGLAQWACIVNLPGFSKSYGGRVYEAMAAGRPVISWDIPNRSRNRALFEEGKEILLFPPDDPAFLARHISRVLDDPDFAAQLARNAHRKMATHHSAEIRIRQIQQWLESGIEPSFGADNADRVNAGKRLETAPPSSSPAVSIVIPCFNQAHFLPEAVESVINQFYGDWECIIVDDGSPDQTSVVARQIIDRHPGKQIRLIRKANGGLADARNAGIRAARGRYILPLDADDRLHPEYLKLTVPVLDHQTEISIVYVDEQNFGDTTHVHRKGVSDLANLLRSNVHDYCTLYRRSVWEVVGGYSPAMYIGAEDWNFWIAAAKRGFRSFHVEKPLFLYRNRSGTMIEQVYMNTDVVKAHLIMHHPDLFAEAGCAQARAVLSRLNEENREKLARVCAAHPDNELLKIFHRLAHSQAALPEAVRGAEAGGTTPSRPAAPASIAAGQHGDGHDHDDTYYAELFIKNPEWSGPEPNDDETARWVKIASFLEHILRVEKKASGIKRLRIVDLGCGRGWLTNLASAYGDCTGVEPVTAVVAHARRLFPHLRFHAGTAETLLAEPGFEPFDIVVNSEVIEHVPRTQQAAFVQLIRRLVKPNGHVILTTPRGEVFDLWEKIAPPSQPIEDWLTEEDIRRLFVSNQFVRLGNERVWIELPSFRFLPAPTPAEHCARKLVPFYQVWAWQAPREQGVPVSTQPFMPIPMVSVIVPTYNRPELLKEALGSILAQTFRDFEIIVVNDGGDDVQPIITPLNQDGCITSIRHGRNRGLAAARNSGAAVARGKYIAYLDDDDRYYPDHLATLVGFLVRTGRKAAYSDAWRLQQTRQGDRWVTIKKDLPFSVDFQPTELLVSNYLPVLCMVHEKACWQAAGGFDESLRSLEDWDLWIRMSRICRFAHLKKVTGEFVWRADGTAMSDSHQSETDLAKTTIGAKYRELMERIPGVLEAQRESWEALKAKLAEAAHWPDDPEILEWGLWCGTRIGAPSLARSCADRLLRLRQSPSALAFLVRELLEEGKFDEAEVHLQALLALESDHAEGWFLSGIVALQRQAHEAAAQAFANALENGADGRKAGLGLVMAHLGQGEKQREGGFESRVSGCELEDNPKRETRNAKRTKGEEQQSTPVERAWELCAALLEEYPDDAEVIHWLLRAGTALNRWQPLAGHLAHFLERNPADLAVRFALAGVLLRGGRVEDARREYETIRLLQPDYEGLVELEQALNAREACGAEHAG